MNKYIWLLFFLFLIGEYVPQKDAAGKLLSRQCWGSTGLCWCEYTVEKEYFKMSDTRECPDGN
tara:strand:+ start:124 stop:312 length:189 start_codon:yes stop_codon:yes gene_type:complete